MLKYILILFPFLFHAQKNELSLVMNGGMNREFF